MREAFGAWVGLYQWASQKDAEVRRAMTRVTDDEISQAAFSLELARVFRPAMAQV